MSATKERSGIRGRLALVGIGMLAWAFAVAPVAQGDPVEDPCQLQVTFLCYFVPIAPYLDGDVDLTQNQPPADPAIALPESGEGG